MSDYDESSALVTGANSGLGFEAAAQLAELGYGSVTLACRTQDKADAAATALRARTGAASAIIFAQLYIASRNTGLPVCRNRTMDASANRMGIKAIE